MISSYCSRIIEAIEALLHIFIQQAIVEIMKAFDLKTANNRED